MTKTNFAQTADWLLACGMRPNIEGLSVQIGCHLEEIAEFVACLKSNDPTFNGVLNGIKYDLMLVGDAFKLQAAYCAIPDVVRESALDALCDMEVTGNGVAYMAGFNKEEADIAVLASNQAKLVDGKPVIKEGGKIGKPPGWQAPDLSKFV